LPRPKPLDALRDFRAFNKPTKLKDGMTEQEWRETAAGKPLHWAGGNELGRTHTSGPHACVAPNTGI
jgi:hypothetical protein